MIYGNPTDQEQLAESMRQFEVVAKVALQLGACAAWNKKNRINVLAIGMEHFGLTRDKANTCLARAQIMLENVSNSISSETLLIAERRRRLRVFKPAA